jgi:hypothetical protein
MVSTTGQAYNRPVSGRDTCAVSCCDTQTHTSSVSIRPVRLQAEGQPLRRLEAAHRHVVGGPHFRLQLA